MKKFYWSDLLWDLWCVNSIIGIWPRFIEPRLLKTSIYELPLKNLPYSLKGLKILQFSDLHLQTSTSDYFLKKLSRKINSIKADVVVFTGDFLCYSQLDEKLKQRLATFLCSISAQYGCYAVFGNHDYSKYVSINTNGEYDLLNKQEISGSFIKRGFTRLFSKVSLTKTVTPRASAVGMHRELVELLQQTPFKLLENAQALIPIKGSFLNICGLGEYTLGKTDPKTFATYDSQYPGIVLLHNPDGIPMIRDGPGDLILCGHTHGGQVNLPWMWQKFTLLENPQYKRGLLRENGKWIYINRGVGAILKFRWFAFPELSVFTLRQNNAS